MINTFNLSFIWKQINKYINNKRKYSVHTMKERVLVLESKYQIWILVLMLNSCEPCLCFFICKRRQLDKSIINVSSNLKLCDFMKRKVRNWLIKRKEREIILKYIFIFLYFYWCIVIIHQSEVQSHTSLHAHRSWCDSLQVLPATHASSSYITARLLVKASYKDRKSRVECFLSYLEAREKIESINLFLKICRSC